MNYNDIILDIEDSDEDDLFSGLEEDIFREYDRFPFWTKELIDVMKPLIHEFTSYTGNVCFEDDLIYLADCYRAHMADELSERYLVSEDYNTGNNW